MRNIALTVEYDGTHFHGFQIQKNRRTVQSELESVLKKIFQKKIKAIGSGRTDSGVHAEAQVVNFKVESERPLHKILLGLNHYLPEDLSVTQIKEVPLSFHSQFSVKWKTYEYRIFNSRVRSPLKRHNSFLVPYPLNLSEMKKAAGILKGKHDFRAFEASGARRKSAVRILRKFSVQKKGNEILITAESNGFLYNMVRSLVGTLIEVGRGKMSVSNVKEALNHQKRSKIGPTVPSQGLLLKKVVY